MRAGQRKPDWLKIHLSHYGERYKKTRLLVEEHHLHTICSSGKCPNIGECWKRGTATLMILGNVCTRSCRFCHVTYDKKPPPLDAQEPQAVAKTVKLMQLDYVVLTSVTRDDLHDGGVSHWVATLEAIRLSTPQTKVEVLIPDFHAKKQLLQPLIDIQPHIIAHNLETVERLTPLVRFRAKYRTSLETLRYLAGSGAVTKSGLMLGLGEKDNDIETTLDDLLNVGCKHITLGQYLQPSAQQIEVHRYVTPEEFDHWADVAKRKGFQHIKSGPLVRSSYHAEEAAH